MKSKILLITSGVLLLLQYSCKRLDKDATRSTAKMGQNTTESLSFSLPSEGFCNLTAREPELEFSLERNPENNVYIYTENQLSTGLSNFYNNFKYMNSTGVLGDLDTPDQKLTVGNLTQLYNVLVSDSTVDYDPDSNYSAVRMHFGMEGKKIILIYEPVALKPTGLPKECAVFGTNQYFRTDASNNFLAISSVTFNTLIGNLRGTGSKIHINHPNNSTVFNFITNTDASGDIRSNIMSMQEIVRMYCDNALSPNTADQINFSIVASQNASYTSNFRMHVVAHHRMGLSTPSSGTFKNYAADYSNMCPINCNVVEVNHY